MAISDQKLSTKLRTAALAAALGIGLTVSTPVIAQEATPADDVVPTAPATVEEEDDGFNWGWLGLLGLGGLAGLLARNRRSDTRTVERSTTTRV